MGFIIAGLLCYLFGCVIAVGIVEEQFKYESLIFIPTTKIIFWPIFAVYKIIMATIKQLIKEFKYLRRYK
jgi:hypothetical protein